MLGKQLPLRQLAAQYLDHERAIDLPNNPESAGVDFGRGIGSQEASRVMKRQRSYGVEGVDDTMDQQVPMQAQPLLEEFATDLLRIHGSDVGLEMFVDRARLPVSLTANLRNRLAFSLEPPPFGDINGHYFFGMHSS